MTTHGLENLWLVMIYLLEEGELMCQKCQHYLAIHVEPIWAAFREVPTIFLENTIAMKHRTENFNFKKKFPKLVKIFPITMDCQFKMRQDASWS